MKWSDDPKKPKEKKPEEKPVPVRRPIDDWLDKVDSLLNGHDDAA